MLPSRAAFVADPCPFWKPPASMGDVTGVAVAGNGELWALVRCVHVCSVKKWLGRRQ